MRPRVVLGARAFPETLALLTAAGLEPVPHTGPDPLPPAALAARCTNAAALIAFMTDRVDAALLRAAPGLRIVAGALKGADNIDTPACTAAGVWVSIVPDLLTAPTAELALGLALALQRHIPAGDAAVRAGQAGWRPLLYGAGLAGGVVGIAGQGRLGRAIARLVAAFAPARLLACDPAGVAPEAEPTDWPGLLAASELLILALPLTPATLGVLDAAALAQLPPGARVVNIGRGSVADEAAVAAALQAGQLGGYAADVFAFEDLSRPDRPACVPPALLAAPRTLFTPHLGSATLTARKAIEAAAARNVIAALSGQRPPDAVNAPRGARG
jgi:phosphonate dehydrogenase